MLFCTFCSDQLPLGIFILRWLLFHFLFIRKAASEYIKVGCYSSLPQDYVNNGWDTLQSSQACYKTCVTRGSIYFALFNSGYCYCGQSAPDGTQRGGSCNLSCNGYNQETCGGAQAYDVFNIYGDRSNAYPGLGTATATNDGNSDSISTSSTSSSTSTNTGAITTDTRVSTSSSSSTSVSPISSNSGITSMQTATNSLADVTSVTSTRSNNSPSQTGSEVPVANKKEKSTKLVSLIGGIVGSILGIVLAVILLLIVMRRVTARREQARMEKEYQEAIKPIDYEDSLYVHDIKPVLLNPFDDTKRISNGSLPEHIHSDKNNVLTVVNPDE